MRGAPDAAIVVAMTETTYGPPLPPPAPPPARLERDPDDKVIAGVCAAFAPYPAPAPALSSLTPRAPPPPARRERAPDDKVIAGVCAAFARYTDTGPVLWRVTIAVLTVFGG